MTGEQFIQYGAGSIGKATHSGSGDIVAGGKTVGAEAAASALDALLTAVAELRPHLDEARRAELDAAVRQISADRGRREMEGPLTRIAGIAALVGEVGGPVVSAVQTLLAALSG